MATVRYTFSLDAIQDTDIIRRLEAEPNVSAVVRAAVREFYDRPTRAALAERLDEIVEMLKYVRTVPAAMPTVEATDGEPAMARHHLDKMKERFRRV